MVLNQIDPEPLLDHDSSSSSSSSRTSTAPTPSESTPTDAPDHQDALDGPQTGSCLVPWPASTYIIRSVSSGHVITLLDGQIVLAQPGTRGSIHWVCMETKGWLGFRNAVSGKFLGYDSSGTLCCTAARHQKWEWFVNRPRPEGGCVLLMTHWDGLWRVGSKVEEQGVEKLAKIGGDGEGDGIGWEFIRVW